MRREEEVDEEPVRREEVEVEHPDDDVDSEDDVDDDLVQKSFEKN